MGIDNFYTKFIRKIKFRTNGYNTLIQITAKTKQCYGNVILNKNSKTPLFLYSWKKADYYLKKVCHILKCFF
jgi:hypothetical protein